MRNNIDYQNSSRGTYSHWPFNGTYDSSIKTIRLGEYVFIYLIGVRIRVYACIKFILDMRFTLFEIVLKIIFRVFFFFVAGLNVESYGFTLGLVRTDKVSKRSQDDHERELL